MRNFNVSNFRAAGFDVPCREDAPCREKANRFTESHRGRWAFGTLAMMAAFGGKTAFATPIAQEPFSYSSGASLVGQNGGTGWAGAWTEDGQGATAWPNAVGTTNGAPGTSATDLPYSTFGGSGDPPGGSATVSASVITTTGGPVGTVQRALTSPIATSSTNTLWSSVEFKANSTIKFQNYWQLTFNDTPTNGPADPYSGTTATPPKTLPANGAQHAMNLLGIGTTSVNVSNSGSGAAQYLADADNGPGVALNATADALQHMFVFKIEPGVTDPTTSAPAIRVTTYFDGDAGTTSATFLSNVGTAAATQYYDLNANEQVGNITGVQYQGANQATTTSGRFLLIDEVNFGTTAADVGVSDPSLAAPEPASMGLIVLAAGLLGRRRRRARA